MNKFSERLTLKKRPLKVFLCHSHTDRSIVHALYSYLNKAGLDVWLDQERLLAGQNWEHEIRKAILTSDIVIACLSRGFNKQEGFRHEELKIALQKAELIPDDDVFIIPVRLEKCDMPKSLRHLHREDLFERNGHKKLLDTLREHLESKS